jgi:hypothetical protein
VYNGHRAQTLVRAIQSPLVGSSLADRSLADAYLAAPRDSALKTGESVREPQVKQAITHIIGRSIARG